VVEGVLHHANARITTDTYAHAMMPATHKANFVWMVLRNGQQQSVTAAIERTLSEISQKRPLRVTCLKKWRGRRDSNPRPLP
jgi:hypothetical protein